MKIDWGSTAAQLGQQTAEALSGAEVDFAFGCDPFVAAPPTGIRVTTGQIKRYLGLRLGFGRRGLGTARRGADGIGAKNSRDEHNEKYQRARNSHHGMHAGQTGTSNSMEAA